jgi:hypothetical protein
VVDVSDDASEFAISFPANARLASVRFAGTELHVTFEDGGSERIVSSPQISALHGASIRRVITLPDLTARSTIVDKVMGNDNVEVSEEMQWVVAIRSTTVGEVWYLMADTFNFRQSLGDDAGLVLAGNLRTFIRRLAAFAPLAVQDAFVAAMIGELPLPPPVDSLMDFLRTASK